MTETITVNAVDRSSAIDRTTVEWADSAYLGEANSSSFIVDDTAGTVVIPSHKAVTVVQSSSTPSRIYSGFTVKKDIARADRHIVGVARQIRVTVVDGNDLLHRKIIRNVGDETGKRPEETVAERLTWLLASPFVAGLVNDFGAVTYPDDVGLDKADFRSQYPGDVLGLMAKACRFNFYVRWNEAEADWELVFRDDNTSTEDTCTLSISNDPTEINATTVFAPNQDAELSEDGEHVYSGMLAAHGRGYRFEEDTSTAAAFADRDGVTEDASTRNADTASRDAVSALHESATEEQLLPVTLRLRSTKVGLVQAGMRIPVHMTHMDPEGWGNPLASDPRYARILRRRVTQPTGTDFDYDVWLELSPQEPAPAAAGIVQMVRQFIGFTGDTLHFANPPTIGNTLLVAQSARGKNDHTSSRRAPNTETSDDNWGTGAWTDVAGMDTWCGTFESMDAHQSVSLYWKTVDSTSQDCFFPTNSSYHNIVAWELSGVDMASATLVRASEQLGGPTYDLGAIGTLAVGSLAFMVLHTGWGEAINYTSHTPSAGWLTDWHRGSYWIWFTSTYPFCWIGHAIGDGSSIDPSVTGVGVRPYAGLALVVPPV